MVGLVCEGAGPYEDRLSPIIVGNILQHEFLILNQSFHMR